ncbi:hypothetical protein PGTUg99_012824 [Puccinia graminis f. sp. tritici]|uniref:Uncharacterized protein n=1 Tax=Puccinia graminis f. sp. tritici TaxID=56615 RepID=A0A5B0NC28_PUCGR|nr:hypothetical protein PGTUg99_012824 [Puccinia graminis f. sp. tritici]
MPAWEVAPTAAADTSRKEAHQNSWAGAGRLAPHKIPRCPAVGQSSWCMNRVLVKRLPEIGVPTPKFLGRREDRLPTVLRTSNPEIGSRNSKTFKRFGSRSPNKKIIKAYTLSSREESLSASESVQLSPAESVQLSPAERDLSAAESVHSLRPRGIPLGLRESYTLSSREGFLSVAESCTLSAAERDSSRLQRAVHSQQPRNPSRLLRVNALNGREGSLSAAESVRLLAAESVRLSEAERNPSRRPRVVQSQQPRGIPLGR